MFSIGKLLIFAGIVILLAGLLMLGLEKLPWFGRMPGDIHVERKNFSFHFPIITSIILSILLTILLNVFFRR